MRYTILALVLLCSPAWAQLSIEVKLHEFVCEFIIDADENEDQFDLKFLIDTVFS